ncbi:hypothetical protein [Pricia sp.]|uniref:hypothetical protein n=1 Tax=Pricia sp. TaxID=2268138 RepID=UPI003593BB41
MKKIQFSHRVMAVFLTLIFWPSVMPINYLYASNNGPNSPEAAGFEPVDATDMVNLFTGDMSYVLPLLNVPSPEGGYPLALSYHAGIGFDQEASWVGLGWSLNPGAINRNVSGVPDDWYETRKYSMMYNDIGVATNISLGASVRAGGLASFAASLNYSSFKATGGETTHDVGISASANILEFAKGKGGLGVSGYLGTNGVGVGANLGYDTKGGHRLGVGLSAFQSFRGEGFRVGANASFSGLGVGIDLSSKGLSSSLGLGAGSIGLTGGDNLNNSVHQQKSGFLLDFFFVDFSYFKTNYWAFDASYSIYNGSLYAGKIEDTFQNTLDPSKFGMDAYEATYESDKNEQLRDTNFSFMSYDKYNVTAQGIGGSISPKLLENGALIMPMNTIRTRKSSGGRYQISLTNTSYKMPTNTSKNFSKSMDDKSVNFYFENEYSSYLNISSGTWLAPSSGNLDDPTDISYINNTVVDSRYINGESFDSYNESNDRLRKGNFIETFTNAEINQSPSKIIQPVATGFSRTGQSVPEKGIGAFKITALDGKTYHYSLPVYHKEQFSRFSNVEDNNEEKFLEQQQFEPYATHWLLTAITGSDYFDYNGNNRVDEGDYGYWTGFEYGKWSDGFAWNSPENGYHSNGVTNNYSWGVKEIYYLDKVKTRTHTALFIKGLREDNKSYEDKIADGDSPKHYYIPFERSVIKAQDDVYYSQGTHLDVPIYNGLWQNYYSTSDFWFYADVKEQSSLKLDKIMLLKNEDAEDILKHNSTDTSSKFAGRLSAEARIQLKETATGRLIRTEQEFIENDHNWYGEYYGNILNSNDIDLQALTDKSLKTIDFNYGEEYSLGRKTSEPKGKLTLNSINFIGKRGVQLIPPYSFEYFSPQTTYTEDDIDDWGYYKDQAMMWSLNKIKNPVGGEIEIIYENDRYVNEYSSPTTFFDEGLEFKYGGTVAGPKTISFRNDANVEEKYQVDFTNYFTAGQSTKIDVLFWHYTKTNSNWIADVESVCTVQTVSENLIVFTLPQNPNQSWGREDSNCSKKNWVYYDGQYNHVVDVTANWTKHKNESSCERPEETTNRSRYRIFAEKEPLNNSIGGGVRVKELVVKGDDHTTKTKYKYTNSDGEETGVTSYAVSKRNRVIPYISELPNPMVMYGNVTAEKRDANDKLTYEKKYVFEIPKQIQYQSDGVLVENALKVEILQDDSYTDISFDGEDVDVNLGRFNVLDYSGNIGRLKSTREFNPEGQLLQEIKNSYKVDGFDHDQGIIKETFNSYKHLRDYPLKDKYLMTSSSKLKVPSTLSKTTITSNGHSEEQEIVSYDFFSGQVKESWSSLSDGKLFKTKLTPAYRVYPKMAGKADNSSNKNMLAQQAMNITEIQKGGQWYKTSASISTWKPKQYERTTFVGDPSNPTPLTEFFSVWHPHKSYVWDGDTDNNGFFTSYENEHDGFDWTDDNNSSSEWKQLSEITQYNEYSVPLETIDINGNRMATKMGYGDTKVVSVSDAGYQDMYYSGAEHMINGVLDDGIDGDGRVDWKSHTGKYSVLIGTTVERGFSISMSNYKPGTYKFSVWVNDGYEKARINDGDGEKEFNGEVVHAGDWTLLNHYATLDGSSKIIYVAAVDKNIFFDDFRIHPIESSMTSYVYNEWDELSDVLSPNNMATRYEYDESGKLKKVSTEVQDFNGEGSGGFKTTNEYDYSYKYLFNE